MNPTNPKRHGSTKTEKNQEDTSGRLPLISPAPYTNKKDTTQPRNNQIAPLPDLPKTSPGNTKDPQAKDNNNSNEASTAEVEVLPKKVAYKHKSKTLNITRMLTLVLANYYFGYYIIMGGVLAPTLTELVYELPEDERNQATGYFGFLFAVGCIVSNILSGTLTRTFGRVKLILLMQVVQIATCLIYRIENLNVFLAMRFVSGLLAGLGIGLVPLVITELIPSDLTGYGGCLSYSCMCIFLVIGSIQSPLLGDKEGLENHWKNVLTWPLLISAAVIILDFSTMFGVESPNYYYEQYADKEEVLKKKVLGYAKKFYTEESAERFTCDFIAEKQRISLSSKTNKVTFRALVGPKYRKQFSLGCILNVLQQMTGINFMLFFSTQLFDDISGNGAFMTIVLAVGMLVGALTSVFVINKGRRPGMLYSTIILVLSLVLMVFAIRYENAVLASIGMFLYVLSFALGFASIFIVYIVEILPPAGAGLAFSTQWISAAVLGLIGAPMLDLVGIEAIVIFFIACTAIACLIMWLFCYETSGKTEEEIRNAFIGVKSL